MSQLSGQCLAKVGQPRLGKKGQELGHIASALQLPAADPLIPLKTSLDDFSLA